MTEYKISDKTKCVENQKIAHKTLRELLNHQHRAIITSFNTETIYYLPFFSHSVHSYMVRTASLCQRKVEFYLTLTTFFFSIHFITIYLCT